jgi:hypothetical protein
MSTKRWMPRQTVSALQSQQRQQVSNGGFRAEGAVA